MLIRAETNQVMLIAVFFLGVLVGTNVEHYQAKDLHHYEKEN